MKRTLLLLGFFLIVGVGLFFAFQSTEGPQDLEGVSYSALLRDAAQPADPEAAGPPWPEEDVLRALRAEWSELSPADSTLMDGLTMEWMYPVGKQPRRFVTLADMRSSQTLPLEERLRVGELLREHPHWRTGVMRHYPALAGVLSPMEKNVLCLTARGAKTAAEMARRLEASAAAVQTAAEDLARVGWLKAHEVDGGVRYQAVEKSILDGGALAFVTVKYRQGEARHYPTLQAAVAGEREGLKTKWVTFSGICPETGKTLQVVLAAGRLRSGKPATVFTAEVTAMGRAAGLFADEEAFLAWSGEHGEAVGDGRTAVALFKEILAES